MAPRETIGAALRGHDNALGLLRLLFASLVLFTHAFPIGAFGAEPTWLVSRGQATLGSIAVLGFFAISGYLIAKSGMSADVMQFMWRRVLRIFPAFWVLLIVTAFAVGPVVWVLEGNALGDYFSRVPMSPYSFLTHNFTLQVQHYGIRDLLLETTPYGEATGTSALNGSIWTLAYEWLCYLVVATLLLIGVLRRARLVVPLMTLAVFAVMGLVDLFPKGAVALVPVLADTQLPQLVATFLVGSCIAVYSRDVPFDDRYALIAGAVLVSTFLLGGWKYLGVIAFAYLCLWAGARIRGPLAKVGSRNDYSYGVYIYGFLVQQLLAFAGAHRLGYLPFVLLSFIGSLACGWLSWHLVEKHAMRAKDWGPGRGIVYWRERGRRRGERRRAPDGASA